MTSNRARLDFSRPQPAEPSFAANIIPIQPCGIVHPEQVFVRFWRHGTMVMGHGQIVAPKSLTVVQAKEAMLNRPSLNGVSVPATVPAQGDRLR
jgi:hypothetical protein